MRPITIFYILIIYVVLQFSWWAYLLTELNQEMFEHKIELALLKEGKAEGDSSVSSLALESKMHQRKWMVMGEGFVFLSLLIWGSFITYRSFRRDMELARLQKNFLLSITHEFKSPLASIKLYLETLGKHELEKPKQQQFIRSAIRDTERLNTLVENALLANLIDHDGHFFATDRLDLSAVVSQAIRLFESVPGHPTVHAVLSNHTELIGDANALTTLMNNLLENAAKYSPEGGAITVHLDKHPDHVLLSVCDSGIGIPDSEKSKVFLKFYRSGNEETRKSKGTGLGLYLVRYIVEKHKGTIRIEDNQPKGVRFVIRFNTSVA